MRPRAVRRSVGALAAALLGLLFATGCASDPSGPAFLNLPHAQYERAFLAACDVARAEGLAPELMDRRAGTIETAPRFVGSALEPWTFGDQTASDVVEGTFGFERRRARFEFMPAGARQQTPDVGAPLAGPILPGSQRGEGADLTRVTGEIEVRVSVSVERQFRPGYQGGAYTRALGSYWRPAPSKGEAAPARDRSMWSAVARDERLERRLVERLAAALASGAETPPSAPARE